MTNHLRVLLLSAAFCAVFTACPNPRAVCGNSQVETGEACDDGNNVDGDGCEADCLNTTPMGGGGGSMGGGTGGSMGGGGGTTGGGTGGGTTGGGAGGGTGGGVGGGGDVGGGTGGGTTGGGTGGGGMVMAICGNGVPEGTEECDDMNATMGDGCENDCTLTPACGNGKREGTEACDDGNQVAGDGCEADCMSFTNTATVKGCLGINRRVATFGETCEVTSGDTGRLVTGIILTDGVTYVGGQVLIDSTGAITCAACDCSASTGAATATQLVCPTAVVSPGLINSHDHISYQASPQMRTTERYEHRHDWRTGNGGHTTIPAGNSNIAVQIRWAELRQVMSGTTSIVGATFSSTGNPGMLRNLDSNTSGQLGMLAGSTGVDSDTFPLGDTSGVELTSGCAYPSLPTSAPGTQAYLPHVAEGIERSANNEFTCLTQTNNGILSSRTALVHGVGVTARDIALMSLNGTSLVWSPRSNVSLYGDTAAIPLYKKLGVNIALGTDWTISGSMNLLRELQCADGLNSNYYNHALTDEELWRLVTRGGADATGTAASIGRIATGRLGDLAIYKRKPGTFFRSVIDAQPQDVVATIRAGKVLYGDRSIVSAFDPTNMCDTISVCGSQKAACIRAEFPALTTGTNAANTYALLQMANSTTYPLFYCNNMTPQNEPSCVPERSSTSPKGTNSKNGSTIYTVASTDTDKDGIADATDNCAMVFNPVRPMDNGAQADADLDGVGDVCDPCPLNANTSTCTAFDPNDRDGDGIPNATDNCPNLPNMMQEDGDGDMKGDVCDPCPMSANPGNAACPSTIYAIKTGVAPVGQPVALSNALVTAVGSTGYFLQVHPNDTGYDGGDYSGIFAYAPSSGLSVGDRINIASATPSNFFGQIQLNGALGNDAGAIVVSSGNPLPSAEVVNAADVATDGGRSAALEGVLIRVDNALVTDINPPPGQADTAPTNEFVVNGSLRVNDYLYLVTPFPTLNQTFLSLTGVLDFRNSNSKLEPRSAADVVTGPPSLAALTPALVYVREDAGVTLPSALTARLTNAALTDMQITLSSSGPEVEVGSSITIPTASSSGVVPLLGVTSTDGGTVTITATLGADMRTAQVRVLGPNDVPRLIALEPGTAAIAAGGIQQMTVRLDIPAAVPTDVIMTLVPNTFGTVPMVVTVPADQTSATFNVQVDAMAMGMGTVNAALAGDMFNATLTVQQVPVTNHPVISEFSPRGPGGGFDEFCELYNPTFADIDLNQWRLQSKSAAGTTWTDRVIFGSGAVLPSKGFILTANTANPGYQSPASGPAADFSWLQPTSGLGDTGVIRLVRPDNSVADAVAFGTGATGGEGTALPAHPGSTNPTRSFERKALATSTETTMSGTGSDALLGNAHDSDNNANDFYLRTSTARDPQNRSSPTE